MGFDGLWRKGVCAKARFLETGIVEMKVWPRMKARILFWLRRWGVCLQLTKLNYELWNSRRFQRQCEKFRCFNLAELEKNFGQGLQKKIIRLKTENHFLTKRTEENVKPSFAATTANNQNL